MNTCATNSVKLFMRNTTALDCNSDSLGYVYKLPYSLLFDSNVIFYCGCELKYFVTHCKLHSCGACNKMSIPMEIWNILASCQH